MPLIVLDPNGWTYPINYQGLSQKARWLPLALQHVQKDALVIPWILSWPTRRKSRGMVSSVKPWEGLTWISSWGVFTAYFRESRGQISYHLYCVSHYWACRMYIYSKAIITLGTCLRKLRIASFWSFLQSYESYIIYWFFLFKHFKDMIISDFHTNIVPMMPLLVQESVVYNSWGSFKWALYHAMVASWGYC